MSSSEAEGLSCPLIRLLSFRTQNTKNDEWSRVESALLRRERPRSEVRALYPRSVDSPFERSTYKFARAKAYCKREGQHDPAKQYSKREFDNVSAYLKMVEHHGRRKYEH